MAARKSSKRAGKKPAAKRNSKRSAGRTLNQILIDLGRQALQDGVRSVLESHGVDSSVGIELALTKPRRSSKAKKPARRRTKRS